MSRGILPLSDSDWGEFLLTFELGLISLLTHHPLLVMLMCVEGGARIFSGAASGALTISLLLRPVL